MCHYTSYLLKFIAQDISSNQRTMFKFLSGDYGEGDNERTNFKWFIDHYGFDFGKWNLLTADYLWDYFFHIENVDLDGSFMEAIGHYNNFEGICGNDELGKERHRVLKVVLLLAALYTKNGSSSRSGATSLLRPTFKNIKACFVGSPIENKVKEILDFLSNKGALGQIDDLSDVMYVMTSVAIDKDRMTQMEEDAKKTFPFEKVVNDTGYNIAKQFLPTGFMGERCKINNVTPLNAHNVAAKIELEGYEIAVFYLFAKNEIEQGKTANTVKTIFSDVPKRCVVIDFTGLPFTDDRYNRFISSKAKEKYFGSIPNQKDQLKLAKNGTENIINEWVRALITTSLHVYTNDSESTMISGGANLRKKLVEINGLYYGSGLEEISQNDKLFAKTGFKDVVAKIAMDKVAIPANYSYLRNISSVLEKTGVWSNPEYWKSLPNYPISKMKIAVEGIIKKGFDGTSMVCVTDIWNVLTLPPFGLMPCTGAVFLMAFLLKEYADTSYYKQDLNNNTVSLNYTDLCELIYGVIKGLPKAKNQYIVRQKPAHTSFCNITGEIFKIAKDKRNSISDISKNLNVYLTNNVYPLWSLSSYVDEIMDEHSLHDELIQIIKLLCEFINPESKISRDKTKVAEEINDIYLKNAGVAEVLSGIVSNECLRTGMVYYIAQQKPELSMIASKLKIADNDYLSQLTKKFSADASYLWEKGDIDHQIDNLYIDLRFIDSINNVLATPQKTYKSARESLLEKLNFIKMPDAVIMEHGSALKPIMQQFYAIKDASINDKSAAANIITSMSEDFLAFFNKQFDAFADAIKNKVDAKITSEELEHLFNNVPSGMLYKKVDEFVLTMQQTLDKYRKNQKIRKMFSVWKKTTGTASPNEWSMINGIPILCMFSNDISIAQRVFAALNKTINLPSEEKIDEAISFIGSQKLKVLSNKKQCVNEFIQYFCDEYAYVMEDADVLRDTLRNIAGNNVYDWYAKKTQCKNAIRDMATNRYKSKYKVQAKDKIRTLSAEQAQAYLEQLIENDPLLGIRILQQ